MPFRQKPVLNHIFNGDSSLFIGRNGKKVNWPKAFLLTLLVQFADCTTPLRHILYSHGVIKIGIILAFDLRLNFVRCRGMPENITIYNKRLTARGHGHKS